MPAELAAGYCGEPTVEAFLKRIGSEYPQPRITDGRRRLWLRDDLDQAILPPDLHRVRDVADLRRGRRGQLYRPDNVKGALSAGGVEWTACGTTAGSTKQAGRAASSSGFAAGTGIGSGHKHLPGP